MKPANVIIRESSRRQSSCVKVRGIKGKVKEVVGKVTGDAKLEGEGKADKAGGKIRNAIGGIKDTLRGK